MATTTISIDHTTASNFPVKQSDTARQVLNKLANLLSGLAGGAYRGSEFAVSQTPASGTLTLNGVGGMAATGSYTFSSATGTTTATVNGVAFQQTTGTDAARATALAAAITASTDPSIQGVVTAVAASTSVNLTAVAKGTAGNSSTTTATGTGLSAAGATLSGGLNGEVDVTIATADPVMVDTTNLSDAAAATAIAASINDDAGASQYVTASASGKVVTLAATASGPLGNLVGYIAITDTGSAVRSGPFLTGGDAMIYML